MSNVSIKIHRDNSPIEIEDTFVPVKTEKLQPCKDILTDIEKTKELVKSSPICEKLLRFNTTEEFNPLLEMLEYIGLYSLESWVKSYFYSHNCLSCKIGNCIVQGER